MAIGDTVRMEIGWQFGATPWALNVYHMVDGSTAGMSQARSDAVGAMLDTAFTGSTWEGQVSTSVALRDVTLQTVDPLSPIRFTTAVGNTGANAGQLLPRNVSFLVMLRTPAGRAGRSFLWGATENSNDANGSPIPSMETGGPQWIAAIRDGLAGLADPFTLGVLRRVSGAVSAPVTPQRALSSVSGGWQTQCRRRDGL